MKKFSKFFSMGLIKDTIVVLGLTAAFSLAYNLIVYRDFNFLSKAKDSPVQSQGSDFKKVAIEEANNYLNQAVLIDARNEQEYLTLHIPNAVNIPAKNFDNYIDKVFEISPDTLVIIYCEGIHCGLSHQLGEKLKTFGIKNIWIMYEGIEGWIKRNLPVEKND